MMNAIFFMVRLCTVQYLYVMCLLKQDSKTTTQHSVGNGYSIVVYGKEFREIQQENYC